MPHIFIATPCYGGLVTARYMHSAVNLLLHGAALSLPMTLETVAGDSLVSRARNTLVAKFLVHPEATHLFFVDADIEFTPSHLLRLLALNEDVAACMYPLKQMVWDSGAASRARAGELISTAPLRYVGAPCAEPWLEQRDGFVTASYAGTGCMLISRMAILRLIAAHPELHYSSAHVPLDVPGELLYALFDTSIDPETRHYLSEDYTFCARWRGLGGKIWLDTQSRLTHIGAHEFMGDPAARYAAAGADMPAERAAA